MKKKTLLLLLFSICFMITGVVLFSISYFANRNESEPNRYTVDSDFQMIDINLTDCILLIKPSEKTYVAYSGYRESALALSETDGKLVIDDQGKREQPVKLSGIGQYFKEEKQLEQQRCVTLFLSDEHLKKPINIVLQDSSLKLDTSIEYLTIHAEDTRIEASDFSFKRFDAVLNRCECNLAISMKGDDFSRKIETHNTRLSLNGDERANAEEYKAQEGLPWFSLQAQDSAVTLTYLLNETE